MKGGEVKVEQRIREIIRFASVLLPFFIAIYSLMPGIPKPFVLEPSFTLSLIMIPWLLLGLVLFLSPARTAQGVLLRLALYHLCAGAYVLFISGFLLPFVPLGWALLLLVSYIYLSKVGLLINLCTLFFITIAHILLRPQSGEEIMMSLVAVCSIIVAGMIVVIMHRIEQTDSKALAESKAQESLQSDRMNTLINNLADAVISVNGEGIVELYNAASLNLLNTNIGLYKQSIDDIIKAHNQAGKRVRLLQIAKKAKGVTTRDDISLVVDDEALRLEVTTSPVRSSYRQSKKDSSTDGYIFILRDITKAKSLEEERDEFISVVSHELRTPITLAEGTLSNVQLMLEKGSTLPGSLEKSMAAAHDQIVFLSKMVNDLSTLSRAERGTADAAESIDVKKLVESLYNEYIPQAKAKGLLFDIDSPGQLGTVNASQLYLRELLQNLITNAIKYTKEGSVALRVSRSDNAILFEIVDTGIGISKGDQTKIFNKFYRSEDYRTRETGGTGLGLYVAAKLAKKLGTKIQVTSRLNHGSTFSFLLKADND